MSGARRRIILVEDDPGVQRAIARLLAIAGFEPLLYGSAEELLGAAPLPAADCMVVDIQLPGENGLAMVDRLAAAGLVPPVIFVTAADDPEFREAAARLGAAYLNKPFTAQSLLEMLRVVARARAPVSG